jgi:hypothetical protein
LQTLKIELVLRNEHPELQASPRNQKRSFAKVSVLQQQPVALLSALKYKGGTAFDLETPQKIEGFKSVGKKETDRYKTRAKGEVN